MVALVALDERLVVVRDPVVSRVEEDELPRQFSRPFERRRVGSDLHRRRVALEMDPLRRDTDLLKPPPLVLAQHLEPIHPPPQHDRPPAQGRQRQTAPAPLRQLGDRALGVKVGDPVGQPLAQQHIQGHEKVEKKRRAAGEQHLVRLAGSSALLDANQSSGTRSTTSSPAPRPLTRLAPRWHERCRFSV